MTSIAFPGVLQFQTVDTNATAVSTTGIGAVEPQVFRRFSAIDIGQMVLLFDIVG